MSRRTKKIGLADSLKEYNFTNYKINGGYKHINEYLSKILNADLNNIKWKIEEDKAGIVRIKIKYNYPDE